MWKKIVALAVFAMVIIAIFMVFSNGYLSEPANGTYRADDGLLDGWLAQTWTFSGTNNITLTAAGGIISTRGTWRMNGDWIYITVSMFGVESTSRHLITQITRDSFFIDGAHFVRQ